MKKRWMACLMAAVTAGISLCLAGCGGNGTTQSGRKADYTLTFYRSLSTGMMEGSGDKDVAKALEDKYFEDTGISVKLVLKVYAGNDLSTQVDINYPKSSTDLMCVTHYLSEADGSAISKYAKESGATVNMWDLLQKDGQHLLSAIRQNDDGHYAERAGWYNCNGAWSFNALPGVSHQSCFAVLLRKDMVEQVKSVTGLDPEEYDISNSDYKNMTFNEFYKLMYAIKQNVSGITYPIVGAPWDIGRVFGTAFGVDSFNNAYDKDGNYVPSQFQPDYDKYLMTMWHWAKDGIWEKDSAVNNDESRLTAFVAGNAACYIAYPEIRNLITVARKAEAANPGSEYMVIAPLATEKEKSFYDYLYDEKINPAQLSIESADREVIGNLSNPRAFYGLILPFMNKNPEQYIKFLDWMYSSTENYELAKYGVKGVHWDEGTDKVVDGVSYKTWKYPDSFTANQKAFPPYAGVWELLENINLSDRIRSDYNNLEVKWVIKVTNDFESYSSGAESIWSAEIPRNLNQEAGYIGEFIENVRGKAWAGIYGGANKDKTPAQLLSEYIDRMYTTSSNYLKYLDDEHKTSLAYFDSIFQNDSARSLK